MNQVIKGNCDPGGQDTNPDDLTKTYTWFSDYGHGISDAWEVVVDVWA